MQNGDTCLQNLTGESPNYQTEVNDPESDKNWHDVTRRETLEGAEAAIDGSVDHFSKKLEATKGPKVVKTFE